jgi:rare lipoprotein A
MAAADITASIAPAPHAVATEIVVAPAAPAAAPKLASAPARTRSLHASPVTTVAAADIAPTIEPSSAPRAVATETVLAPSAHAARADAATASIAAQPYRTASIGPAATAPDALDPHMPRAVATLTVTPQTPGFKPDTRGYHNCANGERIMSAFYWEGKHTASGEKFDPDNRFTAAHRSLPFGTKLMITNPRTHKSVTVVVNDRGPYTRGVSLDMSRAAAEAIGMHGTGAVCMTKL